MYKLLLCLRYLRTRYIALASIISVMLGVATMIVVNSVMSGFATEMRTRIHAIHADISLETGSLDGEPSAQQHMALIREVAGQYVESMTVSVEVFGLMHFRRGGQWIPRPVQLVGIEPESKTKVGPYTEHLDSYKTIREDGVVVRQPLRSMNEKPGWDLTAEATAYRKKEKERERLFLKHYLDQQTEQEPLMERKPKLEGDAPKFEEGAPAFENEVPEPKESQAATVETANATVAEDSQPTIQQVGAVQPAEEEAPNRPKDEPFRMQPFVQQQFNPDAVEPSDPDGPYRARVALGAGLVEFIREIAPNKIRIERMVHPGDDVKITTVSAGRPPRPVSFTATVTDIYKSGMSEYDSNLVFCNLEYLQEIRGMMDPQTQERAITTVQIKLKNYNDAKLVLQKLENVFPPHLYSVKTWEQKQGPLLAAVDIEAAILNVLLFLIIAVAGFGILAIFFMIVVEKTRDIGILKALGASSRGVMSIFLLYGLALGCVGSGIGVALGLVFVRYINEIERGLSLVTGRKVFDERIYYFPSIPTDVNSFTVFWVAMGAMLIAVAASILPARRAARLHPVEALRYE